MKAAEQKYPNLASYLKQWTLSANIRRLKRPEEWVRYLTIPAIIFTVDLGWLAPILVLIVSLTIQILLAKRREWPRGFMKDVMLQGAARRLRRHAKAGDLGEILGTEAADLLESCSSRANSVLRTVATLMMTTGNLPPHYKDVLRDCLTTVEKEMTAMIRTLQQPLMMKSQVDDVGIRKLREREANLSELDDECKRLASSFDDHTGETDLRSTLARLSTIREVEEDIRGNVGHV